MKAAISRAKSTRVVKQCFVCENDYSVVLSRHAKSKYCSYDCFLSTRKSRQPNVIKTCKNCEKKFTVAFTNSKQQFCTKRCANSGKYNSRFGKPGTLLGRPAWNRGLTVESDDRVFMLGRKISQDAKNKFKAGLRSHKHAKNPNYGNTADTLTPEKRRRFSEAAIRRVIAGQSGYKTRHITGTHHSKKCLKSVKFKSSWELAAMLWWDLQDNVASYEYEPIKVTLKDGRAALPDFSVRYKNGNVIIYEIKPTAIQKLTSINEKLAQIKAVLEEQGKEYRLLGDEEIKLMIKELGDEYSVALERAKDRV